MNTGLIQPVPTPSFTVKDANGKQPPSLIHAFLSNMIIDMENPPAIIRADNGERYQTIYDSVHIKRDAKTVRVIVSFQKHIYGSYAIVRNDIRSAS